MTVLLSVDRTCADARPWLKSVRQEAASASQRKITDRSSREVELKRLAAEPAKLATNMIDGFMVWHQNEHLDLKIGPVPRPWSQHTEKRSGR